jgi:hypothetical protein
MRALIGHEIATDRPDFAQFPVSRDWFAADCIVSQPVQSLCAQLSGRGRGVAKASSQAPKSAVDFTDFDEFDTGPEGNIARFEEAA